MTILAFGCAGQRAGKMLQLRGTQPGIERDACWQSSSPPGKPLVRRRPAALAGDGLPGRKERADCRKKVRIAQAMAASRRRRRCS